MLLSAQWSRILGGAMWPSWIGEPQSSSCEFFLFPILSKTIQQEDDTLTYVQHLNALYSDFKVRFENALIMVIPKKAMHHIEEKNVILQEELIGIGTNEDLKVKFTNKCQ
ncbi:hypothetical protein TNCV_4270371 [Trichonephila clavipes]|nr:hypothetical protein TNCV_4270371 [Trichonephila clavipes]